MENTGGELDIIDREGEAFVFIDSAPESPSRCRNLCFDEQVLRSRKANRPIGCALGLAAAVGVDLLTKDQYRDCQSLGAFNQKTSSWIATPPAVRALGGSLFGNRGYERVFTHHNGAESNYAARGFRARLMV